MKWTKYFFSFTIIGLIFLSSCHTKKKIAVKDEKAETVNAEFKPFLDKYALQIGVKAEDLENGYLYQFIDGWMGVPYKWAGNDKNGIDCAGRKFRKIKNRLCLWG